MKILYSPVRVPVWKWKAFGLSKHHFIESERVQFVCDYKTSDGELMFPHTMEIDSSKAFAITDENTEWKQKFPDLLLIPWDAVDKINKR